MGVDQASACTLLYFLWFTCEFVSKPGRVLAATRFFMVAPNTGTVTKPFKDWQSELQITIQFVQHSRLSGLQQDRQFLFCFLTVNLSIIILTTLMHKFLFYNKFIICLYMFRALCAYHQEVKIVLYSLWYHHRTPTYRCDDTRCCII